MPKNRRNSVTYIEADTPDTAPDVWYMPPDTPDIRYNTSPHNETNEPSYYINKINEMRAFYQFLDNAVENGWRLTNEYLAELLRINIQEIKDSDSWFFAGYDFNKICIDFEKGVKEEWWAVNYFEEDQAGVTCLGKNLNRADS